MYRIKRNLLLFFWYISGVFWKQAYNGLLRMQKKYEPDQKISADSSIPINLLNNFHEESIEDVLYSSIAWNYDKEIQELLDKVAAEETFLRHSEEANPSE